MRGIALRPEVLLLDEPASALDPISTAGNEELIDMLKRQFTIVIANHNMLQAARISSSTSFIYLGKLIEFGPTTDMFSQPRDQRTLEYISGRFG